MRHFQITLYDQFYRFISQHLAVCLHKGGAVQQARLMMGGIAAVYEIEEI